MRLFYALLCLTGLVLPFSQFIPWLADHGANFPLLFSTILTSPVAAFAWADVLVSAIVLIGFILHEGRRIGMRRLWLPILGTCLIGVSFGLPLFLFMREQQGFRSHAQIH